MKFSLILIIYIVLFRDKNWITDMVKDKANSLLAHFVPNKQQSEILPLSKFNVNHPA
jgi:hypothetical protein